MSIMTFRVAYCGPIHEIVADGSNRHCERLMLLPTRFPSPGCVLVIMFSRGVHACEIEKDNGVGRPGKLKPAPTRARLEEIMMVGEAVLVACPNSISEQRSGTRCSR